MHKAHQRRFGVEIECGSGRYSYYDLQAIFPASIFGRRPSIGRDGSGIEVRTPILQGKEGYDKLRAAMEWLKTVGRAYVTTRDGMHVHHDAPEFRNNPKAVRQLVDSWLNNQDLIYRMVHPRRRSSGGPAPMWDKNGYAYQALVDWEEGRRHYLDVGRYDLNVGALSEHGSVEIRLHEGTLDPEVAIAWVMFGQRFIHAVASRVKPMSRSTSDERLLSRIRLSPAARAAIAAKQAANHVTPDMSYRNVSPNGY